MNSACQPQPYDKAIHSQGKHAECGSSRLLCPLSKRGNEPGASVAISKELERVAEPQRDCPHLLGVQEFEKFRERRLRPAVARRQSVSRAQIWGNSRTELTVWICAVLEHVQHLAFESACLLGIFRTGIGVQVLRRGEAQPSACSTRRATNS